MMFYIGILKSHTLEMLNQFEEFPLLSVQFMRVDIPHVIDFIMLNRIS
jgi:hypothetical protein